MNAGAVAFSFEMGRLSPNPGKTEAALSLQDSFWQPPPGSRTVPPVRLQDMTLHLQRASAEPVTPTELTAQQMTALERIWGIAGLPPMPGYGGVFRVIAVSSDDGLVQTLSAVDLGDSESVANAAAVLLQWHKRILD
jgi:hypothetical protein